jgi:hypothetical protein
MWRSIKAHWRGELGLGRSYWIDVVLLGALLGALLNALTDYEGEHASGLTIGLVGGLAFLLLLPFPLWAVVGVWRAASRDAREKRRVLLPGLAKLMMVILAVSTVGSWVKVALIARDAVKMRRGDTDMPYSVAVREGDLVLEGYITLASARDVAARLGEDPGIRRLDLSSRGGRLAAAERMADAVRARGLDTAALDDCVSACTMVFLAGRRRFLLGAATLGFHQPSQVGLRQDEIGLQIDQLRRYYLRAGLPPWFVERALAVPPGHVWRPTTAELIEAGAVTAVLEGGPGTRAPP